MEEFKRRGKSYPASYEIIDVVPGVYRFTNKLPWAKNQKVFSNIKWVRNPEPAIDYLAEYRGLDYTAGQIVKYDMGRWKYYAFDDEIELIRAEANFIFLVDNHGWHPNGCYIYYNNTPKELSDLAIPEFKGVHNWYPISHSCSLVLAAEGKIFLNQSFARLAKNVARCIATYGSKNFPGDKGIAQECLDKLQTLYLEV